MSSSIVNKYSVSIQDNFIVLVYAHYVHEVESYLKFFSDEGKEVASFTAWNFWKFEEIVDLKENK